MIAEKELPADSSPATPPAGSRALVRGHLRFGWMSLLVFLTAGMVLESLHGFKIGLYLDVDNEARRLLWTLAHAHGALLAILHLGFALTVYLLPGWAPKPRAWASWCLMGATVLMPAGFFLGGLFLHAGDPGIGILLLPPGAVMLFVAVLLAWRGVQAGGM